MKSFVGLLFISLFFFTVIPLKATSEDENTDEYTEDHSHADIQRGERFFKGLLPTNRKFESCVS